MADDQPTSKDQISKERLEMLWNLSKAARDRFNVRNETEWKICFGLWAAFGAAAAFVLNSSVWKPSHLAASLITAGVVVILAFFSWWTRVRRAFDEKDSQTAYFWESAIEQDIGRTLHVKLRPGKETDVWLRSGDGEDKSAPPSDKRHPGLVGEIVITIIFGLLPIGAVWSRATEASNDKPPDIGSSGMPR
jgi:hypothetical protein